MPNKLSGGKVILNAFETIANPTFPGTLVANGNGAGATFTILEEEVDFAGEDELAPVVTTANLLPANSLIFGVAIRCTEAFTGDAANFDVGDESTATRFATDSTKIAAGNTDVFLEAAVAQAAASKIEFLLDDAATAGKVRVTTFSMVLNAPTA